MAASEIKRPSLEGSLASQLPSAPSVERVISAIKASVEP